MSGNIVSGGDNSLPDLMNSGGDTVALSDAPAPGSQELDTGSNVSLDNLLSDAIDSDMATDVAVQEAGRDTPAESASTVTPVSPDGEDSGAESASDPNLQQAGAKTDSLKGIDPPDRWSAEDKAEFNALSPEGQAVVHKRAKAMEADYTRKTQDLAEKSRASDSILAEFAPYQQQMAIAGMDAPSIARQLLAYNAMYMQNPAQYLVHVAQTAGIDLADLASSQEDLDDDVEVDPIIAELRAQIGTLTNTVQSLNNTSTSAQHQSLDVALTAFQTATVEGNPDMLAYPHFEAVRQKMGNLIVTDQELVTLCSSDPKAALVKAYENAIWTQPELRQGLIDGEKNQLAKDVETRRQAEVAAAEKSGRVIKAGASGQSTQPAEIKSLDDALAFAVAGTDLA
jgi:hypothetical protein